LIKLRSPRDIEKMRRAGALLAKSFVKVFDHVSPGAVTQDLDSVIEEAILQAGAIPAFKGYSGGGTKKFPATTCISVDEEIVHGIPSQRSIKDGQIVGIDAGLKLDGWFSDMACSFLVGEVDKKRQKLWNITREALYAGIEQARPGNYLLDVSGAIQDHVEKSGFGIIRDLVGHGIGQELHEEPQVPNYRQSMKSLKLRSGMTFAIEPMVSIGDWRIKTLRDGWTAITRDRSPAGHFEHTVLVTDGEPLILTRLEDGRDPWDVLGQMYSSLRSKE
jgi:methionyl aminopeptidase